MGLLDLFRRQGAADSATAAATGEPVEVARARARRRLIGAVVLLGVGVIAFPLLFETQPRPIPVDIPIQIPARDGAAPLPMPAARPATPASAQASAPAVAPPSAQVPTPVPKATPPAASQPAASVEPRVEPTRTATQAPAPVEAPPTTKSQTAPPKAATPAPKAAEPAARPGAEAPGRFVVQVGAFAEAAAVREARSKLEKLGLPSYTQVVETSSGSRTRVRLGPFATREDADKAAAKAKAAGLAGTVLAL